MLTKAPRGTQDFFGEKMEVIRFIEETCRNLADKFLINELRTPTFEHTELFLRGVGETTDIVSKEMYTFTDKGDRSITLKPEGTAGAVRAYLENKMYAQVLPMKLFYLTSCFRYEKPQAGRFRQFNQFGVEYFGSFDAKTDAEVIAFCSILLKELKINNIKLHINSLGDNECREKYNVEFKKFVNSKLDNLCDTCKERAEKNPLRTLDCKNPQCKETLKDAPKIIDVMGEQCKAHFETVKKSLTELNIEYIEDSTLVRGLDYYTKTVFEFVSEEIGSQGTVIAGGRYDNLIQDFGGDRTGAFGFAMGIERAMMLIMQSDKTVELNTPDIFIGSVSENESIFTLKLAQDLRNNGIKAQSDIVNRSVKNQMKYADRINAKYSTIIGEDEIKANSTKVKNMKNGETVVVNLDELIDYFKSSKN